MQKLLISISFICYLAVSSGIIVQSHYCMKRLVSTHFFEKKTRLCGKCGMDKHENSGCCRDEVKLLKLDQDQHNLVSDQPGILPLAALPVAHSNFLERSGGISVEERHYQNHSPPLLERDIYLRNRVFRI